MTPPRVLLLACIVGACASPPKPTSPDDATSEPAAADRMATARCARWTAACEARSPLHFATREACVETKRAQSIIEAHLSRCVDRRVNALALERCIDGIRRGSCGSGLAGVDDCNAESLCDVGAGAWWQ